MKSRLRDNLRLEEEWSSKLFLLQNRLRSAINTLFLRETREILNQFYSGLIGENATGGQAILQISQKFARHLSIIDQIVPEEENPESLRAYYSRREVDFGASKDEYLPDIKEFSLASYWRSEQLYGIFKLIGNLLQGHLNEETKASIEDSLNTARAAIKQNI